MDQQLVNDLRTIIQEKRKTDEIILKNQTGDIKRFMDPEIVKRKETAGLPIDIVEPIKPQKSEPPQMPTPPQKPVEPTKKKLRDMDWSYPKIYPGISISSIIMIFVGFLVLLTGGWYGWIVIGLFSAILAIPYIKKIKQNFSYRKWIFKELKKEAIQYDEAMKTYYAELKDAEEARVQWQKTSDAQYSQAMKAYATDMEKYKKEEAEYKKQRKLYFDICAEYQKEEEKATKLLKEFNDDIRNKAEKEFNDMLASLTTYFPPKYINEAETLLEYILDARADTLKEAIELYIKEKKEWAREIQSSQAAEQAEELVRIQKGIRQCSQCRFRAKCYRTETNDGSCSGFEK